MFRGRKRIEFDELLMLLPRKDTDIAWCAGLFDGEGHVACHRSKPDRHGKAYPQLKAELSQISANKEVVDEFHRVIGFGKICGPYVKPNDRTEHKAIFRTNEVEPLFRILSPYLKSEKTEDFKKALSDFENFDPYDNGERLRDGMVNEIKYWIREGWLKVEGD